jgi:hypothetical protein
VVAFAADDVQIVSEVNHNQLDLKKVKSIAIFSPDLLLALCRAKLTTCFIKSVGRMQMNHIINSMKYMYTHTFPRHRQSTRLTNIMIAYSSYFKLRNREGEHSV